LNSVGILGGTFDPIHFGHLRMAQELAEDLGLQEVRFIPVCQPPHRGQPQGPAEHRMEMVRLAIAGNPRFLLDLREFERDGPSYMVDTLTSLRAGSSAGTPLYLLLGVDAFLGLPAWHRWRELFGLTHIVVAHRPGFSLDAGMAPELRVEWQQRHIAQPDQNACGRILSRAITALDISASTIRQTILQGRSVRYLLPEAVNDYIQTHHLYQKEPHGT
jgi:nicotinate-nucleotide adenylyltransferase